MFPSTSSGLRQTVPIICKILLVINIVLFISEFIFSSLVNSYCLSPSRILSHPREYVPSLFLSNLFHLNPLQSGPMGVFHILFNMMTLMNIGRFLEKEFGSIAFLGITLFCILFVGPLQIPISYIFHTITMGKIELFSMHQCGIGFSGVLFGYFIIYIKLMPNEEMNFYGLKCKKWLLPFIQLLILSFLLQASFIGHLSGILVGMIYISGIPGCFECRHNVIKKIENLSFLAFITNRNDFHCASQQAIITKINIIPCTDNSNSNNNSASSSIPYSRVASNGNHNKTSRVEMTIVKGMIVPKSSATSDNTGSGLSLI